MASEIRLTSRAPRAAGPMRARGAPYRVAMVGNGGIYRLAHGPAWRRIARAEVVATCDIVEARADDARQREHAQAHYTAMEDLLAHDGVEIVDLCTPSDTHADLAVQALRAGKHVICEKPMATSPAEAERMIQAARDAGRHLLVGQTRRFDRRYRELKALVDAGRIGRLVAMRRTERSWVGFGPDDWHWDARRSGGALLDLGVHATDLLNWFMGEPPTRVYAQGASVRPEAARHGCLDLANLVVEYPGARRGLVEVSWAHPKAYAPFYSLTEAVGTGGKLTLTDKDASPMWTVGSQGLDVPRYSPLLSAFPETFEAELEHFLDCIDGRTNPVVGAAEALGAVRVVAAAAESIRTGRPVDLAEAV